MSKKRSILAAIQNRQSYFDTYQICLNGHGINDSFYTHSEFNQDFCHICSAPTVIKCSCGNEIDGEYYVPRVAVIGGRRTQIPKICKHCGNKYPWTIQMEREALEKDEYKKYKLAKFCIKKIALDLWIIIRFFVPYLTSFGLFIWIAYAYRGLWFIPVVTTGLSLLNSFLMKENAVNKLKELVRFKAYIEATKIEFLKCTSS